MGSVTAVSETVTFYLEALQDLALEQLLINGRIFKYATVVTRVL